MTALTAEELGVTYGVLFTGYVMTMTVHGYTVFQTYVYCSQYPLDHRAIKATVGFLWLLDTATFGLICHSLYYYLIFTYPDAPPLLNFTTAYCAEIGISVLTTFVVQIYYSHHVWIVSQNAAIAVGIAVISFAAFALGMATTGIVSKNLVFSSLSTPLGKGIMASSQGLTFLSGVGSFAALGFYSPSQDFPLDSFGRFVNKVTEFIVTRGSVASTIQFVCFAAFISGPTKFFWMPFHLIASKVFLNSLLAMLNVREVHEGQGVNCSSKIDTTSSSSTPHVNSNVTFAAAESKPGMNTQVQTNTTRRMLDENEGNEKGQV